jgi:hypothetical protein
MCLYSKSGANFEKNTMPSRRKGKRWKSRRRKRRKTPVVPVVAAGYPLELEFKVNGLVEVVADGGEAVLEGVPGEAVLEGALGGVPGGVPGETAPDCVPCKALPEVVAKSVEYMFMKPDTSSLFCTPQQNPVGHGKTAPFEKIRSGPEYSLWNSAVFFKSWY